MIGGLEYFSFSIQLVFFFLIYVVKVCQDPIVVGADWNHGIL